MPRAFSNIFAKIRFFPMLFKWEIEALWGSSKRSNWTLSPYGIFFIIFFETFYMVTLITKSIWEIRNALIIMAEKKIRHISVVSQPN